MAIDEPLQSNLENEVELNVRIGREGHDEVVETTKLCDQDEPLSEDVTLQEEVSNENEVELNVKSMKRKNKWIV